MLVPPRRSIHCLDARKVTKQFIYLCSLLLPGGRRLLHFSGLAHLVITKVGVAQDRH
jgi:hypothetical protein